MRSAWLRPVLLLLFSTSACREASVSTLRDSDLRAGEGLGELKLGAHLSQVVARYPSPVASALVGDSLHGIELQYEGGGLVLRFDTAGASCGGPLQGDFRKVAELKSSPDLFFSQFPGCRTAPLAGITVARKSAFYRGRFFRELRLGASQDQVLQILGAGLPIAAPWTVGAARSPCSSHDERVYPEGLALCVAASGGNAASVTSAGVFVSEE